jgi:DNA-directed RNA polymerase delta subunit
MIDYISYILYGGEDMSYSQIVKQIAKQEQVSEEEVKTEMEKALAYAGIKMTAEAFIRLVASTVKGRYIV